MKLGFAEKSKFATKAPIHEGKPAVFIDFLGAAVSWWLINR
jgi:hypothetical protein